LTAAAFLAIAWWAATGGVAAGLWSAEISLPVAIQEVSVTALNNQVYVVGGSTNQARVNTVYAFDPASPGWTTRAPYPGTPRDHIGIAAIGGMLYLVGGVAEWPAPSVATVQRYDHGTNTWTAVASLPVARGAMAVAALNGKIYAAGGLDNGVSVSDFTVYDPVANAWQTLPSMPTPRDHAVGVALNGKFYVTGGRTGDTCSPLHTVEVFDPAANSWATAPPMQNARGGHGAAAVNGKLYVFGGEGAPVSCAAIASTEQYDPTTNAWTAEAGMPTARHGMGAAVIGNTIYVPGGGLEPGDAPTSVVEKFDTAATSTLPTPWTSTDIGAVGLAGSASFSSGTFTIKGAGADIWDSSDSFYYLHQQMTGDGQIVARITSRQNTHEYSKVGLMLRGSLVANSPHVILALKPDGGIEFMTRTATGGPTTFLTGDTGNSLPLWLRLVRNGTQVSAARSTNGTSWTPIGSTNITLPAAIQAGVPVLSHNPAVLNTATVDNVSVTSTGTTNPPPTVAISAPANGASFSLPPSITVSATASDSNGTVTGVQFFANGISIGTDATTPYSVNWSQPAAGSYTLTAVATDSGGAQTQSAPVTVTVTDPNAVLPAPWISADIGQVGLKGTASHSNGVFTVKGAGSDIWDNGDSFHYVYQPWTGDGQITARIRSIQQTHTYAKAGVMFRQSLTASSPHVMLNVLPDGSADFISRPAPDAYTNYHAGQALGVPGWLKLIRAGNLFSAYTSTDAVVWTQLGTTTVPMAQTLYVGLAVLSHDPTLLNTSMFDNLSVTSNTAPPSSSISFNRKVLAVSGATSGTGFGINGFQAPTSMQLGPDGRLFVATAMGQIYILTLNQAALANPTQIAVTSVQQLDDIYLKPSRTCNIGGDPFNCQHQSTTGSGRLTLGLLIDPASTTSEITLYVSNSGFSPLFTDMTIDTYSGTITRLRLAPNTDTADPNDYQVIEHQDLVVGLPRSREVHAVNGMSIGPDGWLYLTVGGNTNAGQPSEFFANLPEYYLSAAVVRLNLPGLPQALPIDVSIVNTASDLTPLAGTFELYATGYRNPYDLTWHSNGKLYLNDNAANDGQGNTPDAADGCPTPSITPGDRPDDLNLVTPGAYGGHPNPARGECVFDDGAIYSPTLAPHSSFIQPMLAYQNGSSTNGIVEYTSDAFNGLMKGNLISATWAGNQNVRRVVLNSTGTAVLEEHNLGGFIEPLDVATDPTGNIFVAEHGASRIALLIPTQLGTCPTPHSDPAVTDSDGDGYTDADETANNTDVCSPAGTPVDFDGDGVSDLNDADDDNDGIADAQDQLYYDPNDGASTALPLGFEYDPSSPAAGQVANTGFTGVQIAASGVGLSASTIKAGDAGGHLTLATHAGTAIGTANSQVNGLQVGFDSSTSFRIYTRVVQPFASVTPGTGHAAGIFFGPDQDNFLRLAVVGTSDGGQAVQAGLETSGTFTVLGTFDITVAQVSMIDLFLVGDPAASTVTAYADVNASGSLVTVASSIAVPADWFSNNVGAARNTSLAGLMVSHGSATATAFGFDFFRIDRSVTPPPVDPPAVPSSPNPANGALAVAINTAVSWAASQGATSYDVRFGTSSTPPLVSSNQAGTTFQPSSALAFNTTYFWQVIARGSGGTTTGPVWSFTTQTSPDPPLPPSTSLRRLRVMTWNVNGGKDRNGTANVDGQVSLMARSGAHVIVLQEVTIENGVDLPALYQSMLSAATGKTWSALWIEEPRPSPSVPQGNLVLTMLPVGATQTIDLDAAPTDPTQLDAKRAAGRITVVVNGLPVTVIATALGSSATSRQIQIDQLQSWMTGVQGSRLLGGSFGMRPGEPGYSDLAGTLADVWPTLVTTNDTGTTTEAFGSPPQPSRVDSWWQEPTGGRARATEVWIVKTARSNHHAVIAEVDVR
jgi:N-acetylneuraminic acid mutarotase/glucose/arabinose dehydrogenase/endonuclease/exonuclease/phosphatase family metal-dependent hydrolase